MKISGRSMSHNLLRSSREVYMIIMTSLKSWAGKKSETLITYLNHLFRIWLELVVC